MFLFEAGGLLAVVVIGLWVWAIIDCLTTEASQCRNLPKFVWLVLVLLLPTIGSLGWFLLGRPAHAGRRRGAIDEAMRRRPVAPEDEPRFGAVGPVITDRRSAELDRQLDAWEAEQRAKRERGEA